MAHRRRPFRSPPTPWYEKRPLSPLMQDVLYLRDEGKTPASIAQELGRSVRTVSTILWQLRQWGFAMPPLPPPVPPPLTIILLTERQQDVLHLADATRTGVAIAAEIGITSHMVSRTLKELRRLGLEPRTLDGRQFNGKLR